MRIWGYWATLGWAFLAFMAGQFVALAIILWSAYRRHKCGPRVPVRRRHGHAFHRDLQSHHDCGHLARRVARAGAASRISGPEIAGGRRRLDRADLPGRIDRGSATCCFISVDIRWLRRFSAILEDRAAARRMAPAMLLGAIIVAPAGEEILFRGFLFRGWARPIAARGRRSW